MWRSAWVTPRTTAAREHGGMTPQLEQRAQGVADVGMAFDHQNASDCGHTDRSMLPFDGCVKDILKAGLPGRGRRS
jgi:hypothetical protein